MMGDDSSPDLSLKLRRGSSDSRDSFYLDLDKGIDSDIEDVGTTSVGDERNATATPTIIGGLSIQQDASWLTIPLQNMSGESKSTAGEPHVSSIGPSAVIASPESFSNPVFPVKYDKQNTRVQILSPTQKTGSELLAVSPLSLYSPYCAGRRLSRAEKQNEWKQLGTDALTTTLSALYGKLLVVMGTAFPMAEVISTYVPPSFYEVYYIYLYGGSMMFLFYMSCVILSDKRKRKLEEMKDSEKNPNQNESSISDEESDEVSDESSRNSCRHRKTFTPMLESKHHYGSFYLRMGAVAFGIGSMIYSGLEFGQYFELESNTKCHNIFLALTPITRMAFIFIQMYFIFLNNEQLGVCKNKVMAKFGLMHMIGTNLSVWLNVLVQETKHEILTFYNPENNSLRISHRIPYKSDILLGLPAVPTVHPPESHGHHIVARGLKGPHHLYECRRTNIIGSLVQDASPFLFPCTIEYSLICAAILYVTWKNISKLPISGTAAKAKAELLQNAYKRSPHHYSVDCARAHKGLFVGILLLVLTIISLIIFFVLISRPEFVGLAVIEVNICELALYGLTTFASVIGMWQIRQLKYDGTNNLQLDNILLIGAQTGMFIYSTFTIIGGQFTIQRNTVLVLVTAMTSLLQTACQTIFILDASRRTCATSEQMKKKPGRQIVTFLLVTNLAMWAINTLEKSRAESHPIQLHFYGLWAWTIITHAAMPLAIFYRFHSTVCLCEIWKRAYKMKPTYM